MNSRVTVLLAGVILMAAGAPAVADHLRAPDSVANQMVRVSTHEEHADKKAAAAVETHDKTMHEAKEAAHEAKEAAHDAAHEATDDAATDMDTPVQDVEELKPE